MIASPFELAQRYIGIREITGAEDHPLIRWWLSLCADWPKHDEVPWCSAFVNGMCWELRLPRSKDLRARSWLTVGKVIPLEQAKPGFDVVVLKRGQDQQPPPEVIDAPGHVGFFAGSDGVFVHLLGGNQGDQVSVARFDRNLILGIRRLADGT